MNAPLQLGIVYTPDKCIANIDGRVPLTHLSFAVESIASYFFKLLNLYFEFFTARISTG